MMLMVVKIITDAVAAAAADVCGNDYSSAKFFYTESISLNKAHLTK